MTRISREIAGLKRRCDYRWGGGVGSGQIAAKNYQKPLKIKQNHQIG